MIDWEDVGQRQVAEIQRALPESIKVYAMEVPVFFKPGAKRRRMFVSVPRVFSVGRATGSA
jgi:hypothetical protein